MFNSNHLLEIDIYNIFYDVIKTKRRFEKITDKCIRIEGHECSNDAISGTLISVDIN